MPELPDVELYLLKLSERILGSTFTEFKNLNPFVLRSVLPAPSSLVGLKVVGLRRIGKRIAIEIEGSAFIVIHLMIAGRLRWSPCGQKLPGGKLVSAILRFTDAAGICGEVWLTEAGSKKRASITFISGLDELEKVHRGGIEVFECSVAQFSAGLKKTNQTVKNALVDPVLFSGIGNAYSDEILFEAKLSPLKLTSKLTDGEISRLFEVTKEVLTIWIDRLAAQFKDKFPGAGDVTAFRPEFAVHGKFGKPCHVCGNPVNRIRYADNECNYCAVCQNGGKVLADRAMSRLLK
ncbi:MAG TPA: DNA-formamidopyrimidine glycosylase family protein [Fimbriimonadaceae bacterium]|jgi:formamidopyrimidine-DNA glycosylase